MNNSGNIYENPAFNNIALGDYADRFKTPLYLYHAGSTLQRIRELRVRLNPSIQLYYAVKANPNPHLLALLKNSVDGFDISSGGELQRALDVGCNPEHFSFAGPGKSNEELELAIKSGTGSISIESINELNRIELIATDLRLKANVSVRINPERLFRAFAIKMGGKSSQFGVNEEDLSLFFKAFEKTSSCILTGLHVYAGTQCLDADTIIENVKNTLEIARRIIIEFKYPLKKINLGGGFGIPYYDGQEALDGNALASDLSEIMKEFIDDVGLPDLHAILELGRYIMAPAGIYMARIVDKKESRGRIYCVLDGGMHHHLAASGNFGQVIRKNFKVSNVSTPSGKMEKVTLVGPLCTSIDVMGDNVMLSSPEIGDLIVFWNSGSYAFTASPQRFLSHPTPAEILIDSDDVPRCVRERQLLD
ncbi:type III PLP-dependent enzyme [bacterium]|nr:type III PLP-dependent enzyme [bacterium]